MFNEIKTQIGFEYFVKGIQGSGCGVSFAGIQQEKLIFDIEQFCKKRRIDKTRCDFAVFLRNPAEQLFCILIELKSGALKASTVSEQLKGGAAVIEENLNDIDFILIPLVLASNTHRIQRAKLSKARVQFRGKPYGIALGKCNRRGNINSAVGKALMTY